MSLKKIIIPSVLAAGILAAGIPSADAGIAYRGSYMAPGLPFWPEGNAIGTGKLKLYPEVAVGLTYDDNIYYDETAEESDLISHVIPRLMLDYSLEERGSIRLGYGGDFAYYSDMSDNDWRRHEFGLLVDYNAPSGFFLDIGDEYVDTTDPFGSRDDYALGQQKARWFNLFGAGLGYDYADRFRIVGYFNYNVQEYDNKEVDYSQDFDETEYGAGIEKRLSVKTWGFVRYFQGSRDYTTGSPGAAENGADEENGAGGEDGPIEVNESNDADYTRDWIDLGLTWDATSRITGEIGFGYEWKQFDNPLDPQGNPYEDTETWIASTRIDYAIKPDVTDVHLNLYRSNYQSGSDSIDNYDGTDLNVYFRHRFYSWYKLLLNFGIGRNDYNYGRIDDDIRAGIAIEYLFFRRFTLGLGYDYTNRDSSEAGESFTINRVLGTVTLRY